MVRRARDLISFLRGLRIEFVRPGESDLSGRALWRVGRLVLTVGIVATNLIGACVVIVLAMFVLPAPDLADEAEVRRVNGIAAAGYTALASLVGAWFGVRALLRLRDWLIEDRAATAQEQRLVLRSPMRLFWLQTVLWLTAAGLFGALNAQYSGTLAVRVAIAVALTGLVTATCAYLLTERVIRSPAARALATETPERLAVPGVATRAVLAWALGTGLPVLGLVGLGALALADEDIGRTELGVAMIALGGIGITVGLLVVTLAARATADPIDSVRLALREVESGNFKARVPVYDGTQIGQLQLGFNRMAAGLAERERIREAFGTYVDRDVAEHILQEGTALEGEQVEVTIMFIDVRDFTSFAERSQAPQVVAAINRLFERAVPLIHRHGGHVDKFVGDGLLAVFGAPQRLADHADRALAAAVEIVAAVTDEFAGELRIGVGLNSGSVVAGNIGGGGRLEFSVIGDVVNVAARVEAATRETGDAILVSEDTRALLSDEPAATLIERRQVPLKGKTKAVALYGHAASLSGGQTPTRS